ncbi:hypothetical protein GA0115253_1099325 [Streptomyces sp. Termitarium-T10T-6]|nr:hypothetical protein GA0115253_1099325 [Streptomyces sp. Termitarium-T10T-6]
MAAGKTSSPATEKRSSGKTSVVVNPARTAAFSPSPPGTAPGWAANESTRLPWLPGSSRRSAKVNTATMATRRMVPCRNRVGPSIAMAPMAAIRAFVVPYPPAARPTIAANEAATATTVRRSWVW